MATASLRSIRAFVLAIALPACSASSGVGSVGAVLGVDNETGAVHIRETREGYAAAKAGLLPGDEILMIDGAYVREMGAATVSSKLRGDIGTSVDLTIVRGDQVIRVKLVRAPLAAPAVPKGS